MKKDLYKILLINLKKDEDRFKYVSDQLKIGGLLFDRFEAVNGKEYMENGGLEYDEKLTLQNHYFKLTTGEIGCALSHKRCYQKFLNDQEYKDIKYLLILEDDVTISENFKNILEKEILKNENEKKWDYLQFSRPDNSNIKEVSSRFFKLFYWNFKMLFHADGFKNKIKRIPYLLFAQFITLFMNLRYWYLWNSNKSHKYILRNEVCAGGYLINKETAKVLLELTDKIFYPADGILYKYLPKYKNISSYFYSPVVINQDNKFESSIDKIGKRF